MTNLKVPYVSFMKHAQKVVRGPVAKTRPVLGGVIHREGYIAVTDSHRLYLATDMVEGEGEERNINPITGAVLDEGNYPEIERLIPDVRAEDYLFKTNDVAKLYDYVRAIEIISRVDKTADILALDFDDDYFAIRTIDEIKDGGAKYEEGEARDPNNVNTIHASIKYVKEAFMLFKDAKLDDVEIRYYGNVRPFTIIGGNLTALITPIRRVY